MIWGTLLLLLLSPFSPVRLSATPQIAAHQAPLSLGFSRQEHWNGLPFPSPVHESEKWKWSHSVVSHSSQPHGLQPTRFLYPWDFPGKSTGVGCHCLRQRIFPTQGSNLGLSHCRQTLYCLSHQGSPISVTTMENFLPFCPNFLLQLCYILNILKDQVLNSNLVPWHA